VKETSRGRGILPATVKDGRGREGEKKTNCPVLPAGARSVSIYFGAAANFRACP
jgi:hypothetical protein